MQAYIDAVRAGRIVAPVTIHQACDRHERDRAHAAELGLEWRPDAAHKYIDFCQDMLTVERGNMVVPFCLLPFQRFIIGNLYGWHRANGDRRFKTAYIETGKGSGKTPLAAAIGLIGLVADGQSSAEVYAAASTTDQAAICWRDAAKMVAHNPDLRDAVETRVASLFYPARGSVFRHVSSEARSLDGKRVSVAILDELHCHATSEVSDKMKSGTKGRPNSLIVEITNSGFDLETVCGLHHEHSLAVLSGEVTDDSWFAFVCGLDDGDDYKDESTWEKANPGITYSLPPADYIRSQVAEAQLMPSKESHVRRFNFCQWVQTAEGWLRMDRWDENADTSLDFKSYAGRECWLGVDLSNTADLSALVVVFREPTDTTDPTMVTAPIGNDEYGPKDVNLNFRVVVFAKFYMPAPVIADHERTDRVPYSTWQRQGFLTATPGPTVDYTAIYTDILAIGRVCQVVDVGMDPYNANWLARKLAEAQIPVTMVRQAVQSMSEPEQFLEALVLSGRLVHNGNPILRNHAANAVVTRDLKDNIFAKKPSNFKRIDGTIGLAIALSRMLAAPEPYTSIYDTMDYEAERICVDLNE